MKQEADLVKQPPHYTKGKIEMTDFVLDQRLGWLAGNVIKYIVRYRFKGSPLQDLKKAQWYLEKLIARVESGTVD